MDEKLLETSNYQSYRTYLFYSKFFLFEKNFPIISIIGSNFNMKSNFEKNFDAIAVKQ